MLCRYWELDIKINKYGMHSQAANYNTNLLSIVSLSLRGILPGEPIKLSWANMPFTLL